MSDRILFRSESLAEAEAELNRLMDALEDVAGDLSHLDTSEEWWSKLNVRSSHGSISAQGAVSALRSDLGRVRSYVSGVSSGIRKTRSQFASADSAVSKSAEAMFVGTGYELNANKAGSEENGASDGSSTGKKSWFESLSERVRDAIDDLKDGIQAGVGAVAKTLSDCKAYWVNNWENKGWIYKAVKTTGAVVNIVGSAAAVVTAVSAAVASGGAALPVATAVLIGIFKGNSIANSVTDLYNLWAGDIEQVGEVNWLKEGAKKLGGYVGGMLGYEQAGEKVGEIVYTVGSVTAEALTLHQLVGKIIQTDSLELGNSVKSAATAIKGAWAQNASATFEEAKIGAQGIWHIATKVPIQEVGLQWSLLKGHLSGLESTIQGMKLLSGFKQIGIVSDAVSTANKFIDAGVDVLNLSREAVHNVVHKGDASVLAPKKVLKIDEIKDQVIQTVTGATESEMSAMDDFGDADIVKGKNDLKKIVDGLREIQQGWNFVARTRT